MSHRWIHDKKSWVMRTSNQIWKFQPPNQPSQSTQTGIYLLTSCSTISISQAPSTQQLGTWTFWALECQVGRQGQSVFLDGSSGRICPWERVGKAKYKIQSSLQSLTASSLSWFHVRHLVSGRTDKAEDHNFFATDQHFAAIVGS